MVSAMVVIDGFAGVVVAIDVLVNVVVVSVAGQRTVSKTVNLRAMYKFYLHTW